MHQFDIVKLHGGQLGVLLQSDLLNERETRIVAPLISRKKVKLTPVLHLEIMIGRKPYLLATEKMAAIERSEVAAVIGSIADRDYEIRRALDIVFTGF
ncbi:MAG: CcdB family protein [Hyphomicrobium sp.]